MIFRNRFAEDSKVQQIDKIRLLNPYKRPTAKRLPSSTVFLRNYAFLVLIFVLKSLKFVLMPLELTPSPLQFNEVVNAPGRSYGSYLGCLPRSGLRNC